MIRYTLKQLEYLLACVDTGSLAAAATQLNVTQPTITAAIQKLERQLDTQLLIRQHAVGVVPTAAAGPLIKTARNLVDHAIEFQRNAMESGGDINLGSFVTLAPMYLPGLISGLAQTHPDLTLNIGEGTQGELLMGLQQGKFDAALMYDHDLSADLDFAVMAQVTPSVVLPAHHPLAAEDAISMRDLQDLPFVQLDVSPSRDYFQGVLNQAGITPKVAYNTSSLELARGLVGQGLGYTLLVTRPAGDVTYDGQPIAVRPLRDAPHPSQIVLAWLRATRQTRTMQVFVEFSSQYFAAL